MDYDEIALQAGSFDTDSHECAKRAAKLAHEESLRNLPATAQNVASTVNEEDWPFEASELMIDIYRGPDQGGFGRTPDRHVRITHLPSSISADAYEDRSVHRNKAEAMKKLIPLVLAWKATGSPMPRPKTKDVAAALDVITRALAPAPKTGLAVLPEDALETLGHVREALLEYYEDLYQRKHGGVAMDHAIMKIEQIFAMNYDAYRNQKEK